MSASVPRFFDSRGGEEKIVIVESQEELSQIRRLRIVGESVRSEEAVQRGALPDERGADRLRLGGGVFARRRSVRRERRHHRAQIRGESHDGLDDVRHGGEVEETLRGDRGEEGSMRALRLGEIFRRRAFHPRNHLAVLRLDHVHLKVRQPVVHQERHVASRALARLERRVVAVTSSFPRRALFSRAKRPGGGGGRARRFSAKLKPRVVQRRRDASKAEKVPVQRVVSSQRVAGQQKTQRPRHAVLQLQRVPSVEGRHAVRVDWRSRRVFEIRALGSFRARVPLRSKP